MLLSSASGPCLRGRLSSNYKDFPIFVKQKSIVVESRSD